jgi:hypothetical protein
MDELVGIVENSTIWFIDSTHIVKNGSDCIYLYLKVMPEGSSEVTVRTHDVQLPSPCGKRQLVDLRISWTEQYLLYAYLLENPNAQVLFGSRYVSEFMTEAVERLMGGKYSAGGGSFWYRLNGTAAA